MRQSCFSERWRTVIMIEINLPYFSYDLVVCDPPWRFETYSNNGLKKSPEAHYSTMSMEEIAALPVPHLLKPGGVLVLWCTWPLIGYQWKLFETWGILPKTGGSWAKRTITGKLRWGTGYLLRSVCEPFLIGTLPGCPARGSSIPNMIETVSNTSLDGLAREHSRKPDEFYYLMERLVPDGRRADIFARQQRPGWDCWGNEVEKF